MRSRRQARKARRYESILRVEALEPRELLTTWGGPNGWLDFPTWHQGAPFNQSVPLDPSNASARSFVGCTATAESQVAAQHRTLYPVQDAFVTSLIPNQNFGTTNELKASDGPSWALLKFDLSGIPAGSTVTAATMYLYVTKNLGGSGRIDVHSAESSWNEAAVTWNSRPSASETSAASEHVGETGWTSFSITNLVREWASGARQNQGLILKADLLPVYGITFASREDATHTPLLHVETQRSVAIAGTARYFDGGAGAQAFRPAREVTVRLLDVTDTPVAETTTDEKGGFSFGPIVAYVGAEYRVQVLAQGTAGKVENQYREVHRSNGAPFNIPATGDVQVGVDIDVDHAAGAWNILDNATLARDFLVSSGYLSASQLDGVVFTWYPGSADGSYYSSGQIHIASVDRGQTVSHEFADGVILHEYGHYVADVAAFAEHSPGGLHYINKKVVVAQPGLPEHAREELSFSEGWASFFSSVVQFSNGVRDNFDFRVGDAYGTVSGTILLVRPEQGEVWESSGQLRQIASYADVVGCESELAVWGTMWDLFDRKQDEPLSPDQLWADAVIAPPPGMPADWATDPYSVEGTFSTIWRVLVAARPDTVGEFWNAWIDRAIDPGSWETRSAHLAEAQRVFKSREIPGELPAPQVASFPDAALEQSIREALGIPQPQPMTVDDLERLTSLDAHSRGIVSLEGIQHCVNLTHLYLADNQISDISPLAGLTRLEELHLGGYYLGDEVAVAYYGGNRVSDLSPLRNLVKLQRLQLSYNFISDLSPLTALANLTELDLEQA